TPFSAICPISKHFFPVLQPDPPTCETTGLTNGSRLPFMAYFFSSTESGLLGLSSFAAVVAAGFADAFACTCDAVFAFTFAKTFGSTFLGCAAAGAEDLLALGAAAFGAI